MYSYPPVNNGKTMENQWTMMEHDGTFGDIMGYHGKYHGVYNGVYNGSMK
jgi:hypothetical protein